MVGRSLYVRSGGWTRAGGGEELGVAFFSGIDVCVLRDVIVCCVTKVRNAEE